MTKNEVRVAVKDAIAIVIETAFPEAVRIDDYEWAVPAGEIGDGENEGAKFGKLGLTAAQWYDTATVDAFDLDAAVQRYEEKKAERAANAAEKEAKKREAAEKKSKPRKKKDEDEE